MNVNENITTGADGTLSGPVKVTSDRHFTIAGIAHTSHGPVTTRLDANIAFSSAQHLLSAPNGTSKQDTVQDTSIDRVTTRTPAFGLPVVVHEHREYPLTYNYNNPVFADGTCDFENQIDQAFTQRVSAGFRGVPPKTAELDNHREATTIRHYSGACFNSTYTPQVLSSQTYNYNDPFGACYSRTITAETISAAVPGFLTGIDDGAACRGGTNHLTWHDEFAKRASELFGASIKLLP